LGLYDGNDVYDSCNGCTGVYGWNPVECCDTYRHGSPVLAQSITGDTVYVKANALQWIPDNKGRGPALPVPSDISVERWFSPVANHPYVFQERYKITHTGTDRHAEQNNAVPGYEITGTLFDQFVFCTGSAAGIDAPVTILPTSSIPQFPVLRHNSKRTENNATSPPRRLSHSGYPFTLERQESLPEERSRGIPAYIKDAGTRTFSRPRWFGSGSPIVPVV
jgi:hypothetical protein